MYLVMGLAYFLTMFSFIVKANYVPSASKVDFESVNKIPCVHVFNIGRNITM